MKLSRRQLLALTGTSAAVLASAKLQAAQKAAESTGLKDAYKKDFLIGAALNTKIIADDDLAYNTWFLREFNSITPENCMKWEALRTEDFGWTFDDADKFVAYGEKYGLHMVGHTLTWHSQTPDSVFFKDGKYISKEELTKRQVTHVQTVVERYKGRLPVWDAVNEAVGDDNQMRKSHWYNVLGEEFIDTTFHTAHEVDPKAHLMYNDYNNERPEKRAATIELLKRLQKRKVPVHGVGMQAHINVDTDMQLFEDSILEYAKLGLRIDITELDIDVLPLVWDLPVAEISTRFEYKPERDPYRDGLSQDMQDKLSRAYESLFKILLKHRDKVDRVTFWGASDDATWLNGFPIRGRVNHPLLFDRNHKPKDAYFRLLDLKR